MQNPFNSSEAARQQAVESSGGIRVEKPTRKTLTYKSAKTDKTVAKIQAAVNEKTKEAGLYLYQKSEAEGVKGQRLKIDAFPMVLLKTLINVRGISKNGDTYTNYSSTYMENSKLETFSLYKQGEDEPVVGFKNITYDFFKTKQIESGLKDVRYTQMHFVLNTETDEIIEIESSSMFNLGLEKMAKVFLNKETSAMWLAPQKTDGVFLGFFPSGGFQGIDSKGNAYFTKDANGVISYLNDDLYFIQKYEVGVADAIRDKVVAAREKIDEWINSKKKPALNQDIPKENMYGSNGVSIVGSPPITPIERADSLPSFPTELPIVEDDLPF